MDNRKPSNKKWLLATVSVVMILLLQMGNDPSALASLRGEDMLPVLAITGVVFLLKAGALSAVLMLVHKFITWLRGKK